MTETPAAAAPLRVHLLYLDATECGRCVGARKRLRAAIAAVRPAFDALGRVVALQETHVTSAEQARALAFVASPTIRIDGADVQPAAHQDRCDACGDLCACAEGVDCRVWAWEGGFHEEPPTALLVEALLAAAVGARRAGPVDPQAAAQGRANIERFFAAAENAPGVEGAAACCAGACC